jgi:hypothetical protein
MGDLSPDACIPAAEWQAAKNRQTKDERAKLTRWLHIDPAHPQAWFAMLPFTKLDTDDGPRCAAVLPPNLPLAPGGPVGVLDDAAVFLVAADGSTALHRDPGPQLVGTLQDGPLFTNGLAFIRAWASSRLLWCERQRQACATYGLELSEDATGAAPGTLLIGNADRIHWPVGVNFTAPDDATAKIINIAIWKAARLSRATVAPMKATA